MLERDGEPSPTNERELTEAVEHLLGLGFEHFTSCVVLPQGEFARLLHASPRDRQDLLVSLLQLGLYERMAQIARARAQEAAAEAAAAEGVLATLAAATPEARAAAVERLARLQVLRREADDDQRRADKRRVERDAAVAEAEAAEAQVRRLSAVRLPEGLADHAEALVLAREAVDAQEAQGDALDDAIEVAATELAELPSRSVLEAATKAHRERSELLAEHASLAGQVADAAQRVDAARAGGRGGRAGRRRRRDAELDAVKRQHLAHVLAESLSVGEPCPVCTQDVTTLPDHGEADDLTAAEAAVLGASKGLDAARRTLSEVDRAHARLGARLSAAAERIAALDADLVDHPAPGSGRRGARRRHRARGRPAERPARRQAGASRGGRGPGAHQVRSRPLRFGSVAGSTRPATSSLRWVHPWRSGSTSRPTGARSSPGRPRSVPAAPTADRPGPRRRRGGGGRAGRDRGAARRAGSGRGHRAGGRR